MRYMMASVLFAALLGATWAAQDNPPKPQPTKEHEWLLQLVGDWIVEGEALMDPAKPAVKVKGIETGTRIGSFWTTCEYKGDFMGGPFTGVMSFGFDPEQKTFVAFGINSAQAHLWKYQGSLDPSEKVLTLEGSGPCCVEPGKIVKVKETLEIQDKDRRVLTTQVEKDGKWSTVMTLHYQRKM